MSWINITIIVGGLAVIVIAIVLIRLVTNLLAAGEVTERLGSYAVIPEAKLTHDYKPQRQRFTRMRARLNNVLAIFASEKLNTQLLSANWPITETEFILIRFWLMVAGLVIGWLLLDTPISGIGLAAIAYIAPGIYLNQSIYRRQVQFEKQLIDVLVLLTGAVRAGYSLQQSLDFIVKEVKPPANEEFRRVQYETNLGLPISQALSNLTIRMQNDDLYLLVTAININAQVGGNLVTMLKSVTDTIRERVRLFGEIRALTAQQRFNSYLLTLMPFILAGILFVLNPSFISRLFRPDIWLCFPIGAVISVIMGNIIIRRMAKIEV